MNEGLRQKMNQAHELYEAGQLVEAEPILWEIVREHQGFADIRNMLGVILHQTGRLPKAAELFQSALDSNPSYTEAALNLSVTYNEMGKYPEAREVYAKAMAVSHAAPRQLDPFAKGKVGNMHGRLADAYRGLGLLDEAAREYARALELCPTFVDLRTRLAGTLRELGRTDEAVTEYRRVKTEQPRYLPARVNLGVALFALGKKDEAKAEWESVLAEAPDNRSCAMYLQFLKA